ncbi:MAG: hypothetical protein JST42_07885 [Bacteroidetes bacterium]|nr:hypothetical protein [Bacteroidota bacterium]
MIHELKIKMNKSVNPNRIGEGILRQAITAFTDLTGVHIKVLGFGIRDGKNLADARIRIKTPAGGDEEFNVEIKGEARAGILPALLEQFGTKKDRWLFVSQYIPGPTKEKLRQNGINYLEVTGNCFVRNDRMYLFVNDQQIKEARRPEKGRLWSASGLKLLFVLLQDKALVGATYRELSKAAGIALGSIQPLLEELQQEGWRNDKEWSHGKQFSELRERLAIRWAEIFPVTLQRRLRMGTFRFLSPPANWPKQLPEGVYWAGEPAGELYTQQLVPETFTIYTDQSTNDLVKKLRIVPDQGGNIVVYKKFWQDLPALTVVGSVVPPLLAYADLRNSNDSRSWEIAEKIRTNYVAG